MTTREFESIRQKIESAKEKKARAEGALAKIEDQWKRDFKINGIEEAEAKVKELDASIKADKEKLESFYEKLEAAADWDSL